MATEDRIVQGAMELATRAHAGQLDKSGRPYIGHLERVAAAVQRAGGSWVQVAAAWLHDSLEDTDMTVEELGRNVPRVVADIVVAMTHAKHQPNLEYWAQVRAVPSAVLVKRCDIYDNLDPARMCYLDEADQVRLSLKYSAALTAIMAPSAVSAGSLD